MAQFQESIKRLYWKWLWRKEQVKPEYRPFSIKPFDCSLCLTFWGSVTYLAVVSQLSLYGIAISLIAAVFTPVIKDLILFTRDLLTKYVQELYKISKIL